MKILAKGKKIIAEELQQKLAGTAGVEVAFAETALNREKLEQYDAIFDLDFDSDSSGLAHYATLAGKPVFVSAVKKQLAAMLAAYTERISCTFIGINALPTLINRQLAEISVHNEEDAATAGRVLQQLGWEYKLVSDRVGMVTPRIIFMIINEACYTLQEGTAGMRDIDTSMKLGTNYPFGPFEWADRIGIGEVYETLSALYEDTRDERYKICPLLKTFYLKKGTFYH